MRKYNITFAVISEWLFNNQQHEHEITDNYGNNTIHDVCTN